MTMQPIALDTLDGNHMETKFNAFIADLAIICEKHRVYLETSVDYDNTVAVYSSPKDCTTAYLMQGVFTDETDESRASF
jgi:hypothetical protein